MLFIKGDDTMKSHFEVTFPLVLDFDGAFNITFGLQKGDFFEFSKGMYFLSGDNGVGKTTFVNLLALIAGQIGEKAKDKGTIRFNGEAYNRKGFDYLKAADIREKYFCVFPQKTFFLPVSTRDNYIVLNGSEMERAADFSSQESPDLLSGGQQQKRLMDIVLDAKKPVWFLDEPLTNMDVERRLYFWKTMEKAFNKELYIAFFIDHYLDKVIKKDETFQHRRTLSVSMENRQQDNSSDNGYNFIEIYENSAPEEFFIRQIKKIEKEKALKEN